MASCESRVSSDFEIMCEVSRSEMKRETQHLSRNVIARPAPQEFSNQIVAGRAGIFPFFVEGGRNASLSFDRTEEADLTVALEESARL